MDNYADLREMVLDTQKVKLGPCPFAKAGREIEYTPAVPRFFKPGSLPKYGQSN